LLIAKADATVVPVFFDGHNSRLFQIASHLHYTLRMALLVNEFKVRVGDAVRVVIGRPLARAALAAHAADARSMMEYLRSETYRLSPRPLADLGYGFEFEDPPSRSTPARRDRG
jgi:putative hemolysin